KNFRPLSNMTFEMALRRMGVDATPHGFRSTFRDWASEKTSHSSEVCEKALAHTIKNSVEAAYRRGDFLDNRRPVMGDWAAYATSMVGDTSGKTALPSGRKPSTSDLDAPSGGDCLDNFGPPATESR